MKLLITSSMLLFFVLGDLFSQRILDPNRNYTWSLNPVGAKYRVSSTEVVENSAAESYFTNIISASFSTCLGYANRNNWSITYTSDYASADIKFYFIDRTAWSGWNPVGDGFEVELKRNCIWNTSTSGWGKNPVEPYMAVVRHEIGHLFYLGHHTGCVMQYEPTTFIFCSTCQSAIEDTHNPKFDVTIKNYFSGNLNVTSNSVVTIDDALSSPQDLPVGAAGTTFNFGEKQLNILVSAKRQEIDGHYQNWDSYHGSSVGRSNGSSWEIYQVGSGQLDIRYKRECNMTYQTYYDGAVRNGTMKFNGVSENVTKTVILDQDSNIQVEALMQSSNNINYYFEKWNEDGNTQNPRTFIANQTTTYTAKLKGYAYTAPMNVQFVGSGGDPIQIDWIDHPNSAVTAYEVWRCDSYFPYPTGKKVASMNRGTTYYTDNTYTYYDGSGTALNLKYAVIAKYSTDDTWSVKNWSTTLGEFGPIWKSAEDNETATDRIVRAGEIEYSLVNNPNPFNPTTAIHYSIGSTEPVIIKVYNTLGKEVAVLVDEVQGAGEHRVSFDASHLASGIYFYTIQTPNFATSKKMILMK
ncbi:MAG: T9SS type A sorting domain-containing protein [Bacteroidetes bacterium]|nr:T9SS type A sorting domain-containing protein [Bacteroidota bacterium]